MQSFYPFDVKGTLFFDQCRFPIKFLAFPFIAFLHNVGQPQHLKGNLHRFEGSGFFADSKDLNDSDSIALPDRIDNILSFNHVTEDRMLAVQPGCPGMCNEKLRFVGVRTGIGHG